jgi:hypothetical protein
MTDNGVSQRLILLINKQLKIYAEKIALSGVRAVDAFVNGHGANHDIKHGR